MFKEHRVDPREFLSLPVRLQDGTAAITRDISPGGMYLEIPGRYDLQSPVVFEMHLTEAGMKFTAQGVIVRVEYKPASTGVAVRLLGPRLVPLR